MAPSNPTTAIKKFNDMLESLQREPSSLSLPQFKGRTLENGSRVEYQETMYYIYRGVFDAVIEAQLRNRYKTLLPDYSVFVAPTINPFRMVAIRKAQTYVRPPFRTVIMEQAPVQPLTPGEVPTITMEAAALGANEEKERQAHRFFENCVDFNRSLYLANVYQHGMKNPLLWPYLYDSKGRALYKAGGVFQASEDRDYRIQLRVPPPPRYPGGYRRRLQAGRFGLVERSGLLQPFLLR